MMQTSNNDRAANRPKLWSLVFIKVGIVTSLIGICAQMFLSAFPQYLNQNGFSATQIGLVASGYTISAMIMRIFAGNLIDKKGRRVMCLLGLMLFGAPIIGFYTTSAMTLVVILRFVQGFGSSVASIATGTMAPDVLPKERMAEGIGYYGLFNSVATAIGPAVGIGFMIRGMSKQFFACAFMVVVLAALTACTINYEKKEREKKAASPLAQDETDEAELQAEREAAEDEKRCFIWKFFDKKAMPAACITVMIAFSMTIISNYISPYGISIGLSAVEFFFSIQAIFLIIAKLLSGRVAAKIGIPKTILVGLILDTISMILLAVMRNNEMMILASAIRGIGGGLYLPLLNVLAVHYAAKSRRGKATSTYYAAFDIGGGLGAPFWGFIADNMGGYRAAFLGAGLFTAFSASVIAILITKKVKIGGYRFG